MASEGHEPLRLTALSGTECLPCGPLASPARVIVRAQVYVVYFKTNRNFIHEFPNMSNYVKDLYSNPGGHWLHASVQPGCAVLYHAPRNIANLSVQ